MNVLHGWTAPMAQWVGAKPQESKSHGFESHRCHLVQAYGRRYVQVRPVRPKINHFQKQNKIADDICQQTTHCILCRCIKWEPFWLSVAYNLQQMNLNYLANNNTLNLLIYHSISIKFINKLTYYAKNRNKTTITDQQTARSESRIMLLCKHI